MITVLPECTLSVLALVILLARSASHKLNRLGDVLKLVLTTNPALVIQMEIVCVNGRFNMLGCN
jgi:hypothetical protein